MPVICCSQGPVTSIFGTCFTTSWTSILGTCRTTWRFGPGDRWFKRPKIYGFPKGRELNESRFSLKEDSVENQN